MILVLAIILFIIFLIYSIRPSKSEEYTLEGLKLSWANKASIEGDCYEMDRYPERFFRKCNSHLRK